MTDDEIRVAVAEACGWSDLKNSGPFKTLCGNHPQSATGYPPDYPNDLNAMHEAEELIICSDQNTKYVHELEEIVWNQNQYHKKKRATVSATARQRTEAFLRTLGKWRD